MYGTTAGALGRQVVNLSDRRRSSRALSAHTVAGPDDGRGVVARQGEHQPESDGGRCQRPECQALSVERRDYAQRADGITLDALRRNGADRQSLMS